MLNALRGTDELIKKYLNSPSQILEKEIFNNIKKGANFSLFHDNCFIISKNETFFVKLIPYIKNFNIFDNNGDSLFNYIIKSKLNLKESILKNIINYDKNIFVTINSRDKNNNTSLYLAIENNLSDDLILNIILQGGSFDQKEEKKLNKKFAILYNKISLPKTNKPNKPNNDIIHKNNKYSKI